MGTSKERLEEIAQEDFPKDEFDYEFDEAEMI